MGGAHCEESKAFGEEAFPFSRTVWYLRAENLHRDANFHAFQHRVCSRIKRSLCADRRVSTKLLHYDAVTSTTLMTQHTFTFHVT